MEVSLDIADPADAATGTLLIGINGLTRVTATCQTCFSSTTQHKWDSATPILFQDTWTPTPAISLLCPMQLAQTMPLRWVPAELTHLRTSPTRRIQPKVLHRACGRHCRVSWVHSRSTLPMEFTSPRRAMVATMVLSSMSKWTIISVASFQDFLLTKADTSSRKTS